MLEEMRTGLSYVRERPALLALTVLGFADDVPGRCRCRRCCR